MLSNIGSNNMANTRKIYMPQALTIARRGDPEQPASEGEEYIEEFRTFPKVRHNKLETETRRNAKVLWRLVGGVEVRMSLNLASRVTDMNSWEVMLTKILNGIRS